jgi:hypothetical protein
MQEGTPNWEMMFNILNIHSKANHRVARHPATAPATAPSRLEKLPRPVFSPQLLEGHMELQEDPL